MQVTASVMVVYGLFSLTIGLMLGALLHSMLTLAKSQTPDDVEEKVKEGFAKTDELRLALFKVLESHASLTHQLYQSDDTVNDSHPAFVLEKAMIAFLESKEILDDFIEFTDDQSCFG